MITTMIEITYSEDFRENNIASRVYGVLRDNNLNPISVHISYWASRGFGEAQYNFDGNTKLSSVSDKSKLDEMLQEINLMSLKITHNRN